MDIEREGDKGLNKVSFFRLDVKAFISFRAKDKNFFLEFSSRVRENKCKTRRSMGMYYKPFTAVIVTS
jgi:hypothetical protein